jgi:hypothetical protein
MSRSWRGSQSGFPLLTPIAPFQGFARRCGIQVFRSYATPSPVTKSQVRSVMIRVSPSHPYNAGRAQDSDGGGGGWLRTDVYAACSGGVVVVALRDLVACEFSVRRPRGGRSVILRGAGTRPQQPR